MTSSSLAFVVSERRELADLLDELGPDAPTCDVGWTTAHLAAHVVVRDRRLDSMPGYALEAHPAARPLATWSHHLEDRLRRSTPYAEVVSRVRAGPPAWLPGAWPVVARLVDTAEFAIHHEDVRRAQPHWSPRDLRPEDQDRLWATVPALARGLGPARPPGGLVVRRTDVPEGASGRQRRLHQGTPTTTVAGPPLEVLLWVSGRRDFARVAVTVD